MVLIRLLGETITGNVFCQGNIGSLVEVGVLEGRGAYQRRRFRVGLTSSFHIDTREIKVSTMSGVGILETS